MSDGLEEKVKRALQAIPEDPDAPARLVTQLAAKRRPIGRVWLVGGAAVTGAAGFAVAYLQGPVLVAQDAALVFLGGAL